MGLGVWRPLVSGLVRPVAVVVDQVLAEYQGQVAFADDQDPVQELAAQGSDDGVYQRRRFTSRDNAVSQSRSA
jgi:hypothetical protein